MQFRAYNRTAEATRMIVVSGCVKSDLSYNEELDVINVICVRLILRIRFNININIFLGHLVLRNAS